MTLRLARTLLIVVALLALAGGNVFAYTLAPCPTAPTSLFTYITTYGATGCTIGDKLFSNFQDLFVEGQQAPNLNKPQAPDDTQIYVTPISGPNIGLYIDFHSTSNGVAYDQTLNIDINYLVSIQTAGYNITSVYTQATGGLSATQHGAIAEAEKDLCVGGTWVIDVLKNTDTCTGGTMVGGPQFTLGTYWMAMSGSFAVSPGQTFLNVSDQANLYGGTLDNGGATAGIYSMTNEFIQSPTGIPEPATFLLLGSALLGLGALRRKRG